MNIKNAHRPMILGVLGETMPNSFLDTVVHHEVDENGVGFMHPIELESLLKDSFWMRRHELEQESNGYMRHLIPYLVFVRLNDLEMTSKVLCYKRTETIGEKDLIDKHSVGFGGHIDLEPSMLKLNGEIDPLVALTTGITRELEEEEVKLSPYMAKFYFESDYPDETMLICSRIDAVASRHAGLVYVIEVPDDVDVSVVDPELISVGWKSVEEAQALPNVENWSATVLKHLKTMHVVRPWIKIQSS